MTGKCSKHRRTTVRFRVSRREQRIGIFWEFRLREQRADARCECDGRSKSRIKLNVNMSVDVLGTLQDRWLSFRILNTPNTGYLDNIVFRMS